MHQVLRFNTLVEQIPANAENPPLDAAAYLFPSDDRQVSGRWIMSYREAFNLRSKGFKVLFLVEAE